MTAICVERGTIAAKDVEEEEEGGEEEGEGGEALFHVGQQVAN